MKGLCERWGVAWLERGSVKRGELVDGAVQEELPHVKAFEEERQKWHEMEFEPPDEEVEE